MSNKALTFFQTLQNTVHVFRVFTHTMSTINAAERAITRETLFRFILKVDQKLGKDTFDTLEKQRTLQAKVDDWETKLFNACRGDRAVYVRRLNGKKLAFEEELRRHTQRESRP